RLLMMPLEILLDDLLPKLDHLTRLLLSRPAPPFAIRFHSHLRWFGQAASDRVESFRRQLVSVTRRSSSGCSLKAVGGRPLPVLRRPRRTVRAARVAPFSRVSLGRILL